MDDVDLLLFASEQLRERDDAPLVRALLANTVARVAAWDFETAAALVAEGATTISAPAECLRGIACAKGWTVDTPVDWRLGTGNRGGWCMPRGRPSAIRRMNSTAGSGPHS